MEKIAFIEENKRIDNLLGAVIKIPNEALKKRNNQKIHFHSDFFLEKIKCSF